MIVGRICEKHPELNGIRRDTGHCLECHKESLRRAYAKRVSSQEGREKHRVAVKVACAKRRANNPDLVVRERDAMREKRKDPSVQEKGRQYTRAWREANPEKSSWMARVRRDNVAQRTPGWANQTAIAAIYRKARELGQTVDHVVPLQGKNVSGLHVEYNLQILPRSENSAKGNRF